MRAGRLPALAAGVAMLGTTAQARDWSGFHAGARAGYGTTDFDGFEQVVSLFGDEFQVASDPAAIISMAEFFSLNDPSCACVVEQEFDTEGLSYGVDLVLVGANLRF